MASKPKRPLIDREAALIALALNGDNLNLTSREIDIPVSTLKGWRDRDPEHFAEIQNQQAPAIAERVASKSEALALKAIEVENALLAKAMDGIDDMKGTDAAAAFRNISTGKALQFDKLSNPIRGRNHVRVDERDLDTIIASLGRRYGLITDSTATEITDAELALPSDVAPLNARELGAGGVPEATST